MGYCLSGVVVVAGGGLPRASGPLLDEEIDGHAERLRESHPAAIAFPGE
jgi:hypothetical protein